MKMHHWILAAAAIVGIVLLVSLLIMHPIRRERGHAASCCAPRALPGALVGGDSARRRITRAAFTSASSW
jgi:hypothetical protein